MEFVDLFWPGFPVGSKPVVRKIIDETIGLCQRFCMYWLSLEMCLQVGQRKILFFNVAAAATLYCWISDTFSLSPKNLFSFTLCMTLIGNYVSRCSLDLVKWSMIAWHINSLWPSDAIWRQRSGSTLVQVMACCLTAPSHYLNQCWLTISEVQWHSPAGNFTRDTSAIDKLN